jgi:hypothetical protein
MRHHARTIAIAACVALTGSVAQAAPNRRDGSISKISKKAKHRAKVAPPVEEPIEIDEDVDDEAPSRARPRHAAIERDSDTDRVAFVDDIDTEDEDDEDDSVEVLDVPVKVRKRHRRRSATTPSDWNVAIGPYLWMASVDANVSSGSSSVGAGVDFFAMKRHARYGAMVAAEARHGRFSMSADLLYGVVGLEGAKDVGPLMVTLDGTASSLLVDGGAGYRVTGGDHSVLSIEARGGVRYQRTSVTAAVSVGGGEVGGTTQVQAGADALAGARILFRPSPRFSVSGKADVGVVGSSNLTWSVESDASVRIGSRVLLSIGYRKLTIDRANIAITMHGPRATLQLLF